MIFNNYAITNIGIGEKKGEAITYLILRVIIKRGGGVVLPLILCSLYLTDDKK
jgi:hypothetical protein